MLIGKKNSDPYLLCVSFIFRNDYWDLWLIMRLNIMLLSSATQEAIQVTRGVISSSTKGK